MSAHPLHPLLSNKHRSHKSGQCSLMSREIERVEALLPGCAYDSALPSSVVTLAVEYAGRYQADLLQLEHEWPFLYNAMLLARRAGQNSIAKQLAFTLARLVGRLQNPRTQEHILRVGIEAARATDDSHSAALFRNRLGGLLFARGHYTRGRKMWIDSLELAHPAAQLPVWESFATFAYIADIVGTYPQACRFVQTARLADPDNQHDLLAVAIFVRGFHARLAGDCDTAGNDFRHALQYLVQCDISPISPPSPAHQSFAMILQTEIARLQGEYARAQAYAQSALSLAHAYGDQFTLVDLLIDQAFFTHSFEQFSDTAEVLQRLQGVASRSHNLPLRTRCRLLERQLASHAPTSAFARNTQPEPLTDREQDVLRLLAEGFDNTGIAAQLVVTPGTVRKHLEHIYSKLDAHSRTSAIAKARTLNLIP